MIYEIGNYRIKPYENHLCWEIFEYREVTSNKGENKGKTAKKWVSAEKYPSTFGHALQIVYEMMLMDCREAKRKPDDAVKGVRAISKHVREVEKRLMETVEKGA